MSEPVQGGAPPLGCIMRHVTMKELGHCFRCGLLLLPGDAAMQAEGTQSFGHYDTSPHCPARV